MKTPALLLLLLSACAPPMPPPVPPTPAPTPTPTPTPAPTPTPCAPAEGTTCEMASEEGRHWRAVDAAITTVRTTYPLRFGPEVFPGSARIHQKDGTPYPSQDDFPEWFAQAVIAELQRRGLCARLESDEIAVSDGPAVTLYENYHVIIADRGPRTAYGPGMFKAWCRITHRLHMGGETEGARSGSIGCCTYNTSVRTTASGTDRRA